MLSYIKETALLGVVTIRGSNRETWRSAAIGSLILACILDVYRMLTARIAIDKQELTMVGQVSCCFHSRSDSMTVSSGMTRSGCYVICSSLSCPSSCTSSCLLLSPLHLSPSYRKQTWLSRHFTDGYSCSSLRRPSPPVSQSSGKLLEITGRLRGWRANGHARTRP